MTPASPPADGLTPHRPDRPIPPALRLLRTAVRQIRIWRGQFQSLGKLSFGPNSMLGPGCSFLAPDFIRLGINVSLGAGVIMESNATRRAPTFLDAYDR